MAYLPKKLKKQQRFDSCTILW